ncbi:hypothetical protein [Actinacidiphila alni]|uniref:hypothetical protein n=1 Tax=Actinacidiphila alni TaxID=380248 RepID=UPI001FE2FE2B|nr:hypothetical protein [Actinacidiphila alni]
MLQFLEVGTAAQVKVFAASCAERMAQLFTGVVGRDAERLSDVELAIRCMERLWEFEADGQWDELSQSFESLPELSGEDEPMGALAYAYDSAACLYYASVYRGTLDSVNVQYCSNHALNGAGFMSGELSDGVDREEIELECQLRDIGDLSLEVMPNIPQGLVASIRARSRELSRIRLMELLNAMS